MALVMSASTFMSSMVVYASGINNYVDELDLQNEYVNSEQDKYHNDEAAEVAEKSEAVKAMNQQVEKAQAAVKDAQDAVTEAEEAVTEAEEAATAATAATTEATTATTEATAAATEADEKVDGLEAKDTPKGIDEYNAQVADDQDEIDKNEQVSNVANAAAATAANEADKASEAADAAKAALEKALAVDTNEVNDEVRAAVEEANQAAADAKKAADNAEAAKKEAEDEVAEAIEKYNLYAMSYNLPLYGEITVTYNEADAKAAVEAAGMIYQAGKKAKLESEIRDISDTTLAAEEAKVNEAVEALEAAKGALATAEASAKEANEAAEEATKVVEAADEEADAAANAVNNYYVTPAQEAVDATNAAIEAKRTEIDELNTVLENAKAAAKINGETSYNNELEKKKKEMEDAEKAYNDCSEWMFVDKMLLKLVYDNAKSEYDAYNSPDKKNEVVNNYIENDDAVKAANANVISANSELLELNKQYTKEAGLLAAETATRDAYIADATKNADAEMREAFVDEIKTILNKYSDEINQIDYDEDLNAWANDTFNTWYLYDKGLVRNKMNDKYVDSLLESIFNALGITQWIVDTDSAEEVMDELRAAYKECIEDYYEKLAAAEANWAAMDTEAAKKAVAEEVENMKAVNTTISEAKTAVSTADSNLTDAQDIYDDAAKRLESLKESVANKQFDSVTMAALRAKIAEAQAAVDEAEEELKEAQASKVLAENYAAWANELVKVQYTRAYSQAVTDENGVKSPAFENLKNYDVTNENITSRPSADFICVSPGTQSVVVPYAIYRDYVEAMYEKYDIEKNGKGTSVGSNMDVIFWEVDKAGVLTGKTFATIDELSEGIYFVGYSFKKEKDGYHVDGVMYEYKKPVMPASTPSGDDDDTEPKTTPTVRLDGEVIIIEDEGTPLARVTVLNEEEEEEIVVIEDEDVPLATFEDEEENDVEIEEEAVPLAVAVDENCIIHWIIAIIMVAYAAYEVIRALTRKGKEVKKSEYVLTGVYVAVIVLLMSLGKCEADIFATVGGSVVAVAGIVCKMIQAKKANSRVADTE